MYHVLFEDDREHDDPTAEEIAERCREVRQERQAAGRQTPEPKRGWPALPGNPKAVQVKPRPELPHGNWRTLPAGTAYKIYRGN